MIHTGFNNEINRLILPSNLVHFIVKVMGVNVID